MIISVASGKGGTGKTTISTNLARALNGRACLLDCDVEEPNAHLFINPTFDYQEKRYATIPVVVEEKCSLCGRCAEICQFSAITVLPDTILTFPQLCHDCGGCKRVCPEDAIIDGKRELGIVESGFSGELKFTRGVIRVGEAMAPPLIKMVREFQDSTKITIIDAPPGTSCPVVSAMKNTDFVLMVTEPTPFGLHDLTLAVDAVRKLGIKHGLVINRASVGNQAVYDFARKEGIKILMEIPFDRAIAESYSKGELLVDRSDKWRIAFESLYSKIESLVN